MRNPVRPRLRAFMDSTRGFRRPRACLLLARSLVLAVSVVAFVRLSISSESGHTADFVERGEWARERLAGSKATRGFVNQRVSHDKPEVSTESPSQRSTPPLFPPKESLPENAVTFVLVATMNPDSAPRIANLLASMRTFLDKDTPKQVVAELLVLVPDAELEWWLLAASALGNDAPWGPTRVVAESHALPTPVDALRDAAPNAAKREQRGLGYRVQMLLKLAAANLVRTEFYVTLDCDVVLGGGLKRGDLVRGGKGLVQGSMGGPHAKRWLAHSLDALFGDTPGSANAAAIKYGDRSGGRESSFDLDGEFIHPVDGTETHVSGALGASSIYSRIARCGIETSLEGIGVTPAVLSTSVASGALHRLSQVGSSNWDTHLFNSLDSGLDWTEYGVYAAFACVSNVFEEKHGVFDDQTRLYDASLQEDGSKFSDETIMRDAFHGDDHAMTTNKKKKKSLFVVVQSIGGSDPRSAARALKPYVLPDESRKYW